MTAGLPPSSYTKPMREITAETAADYLRESERFADQAEIHVRELSGGVSNIVLRVDFSGRPPFVIKQCRERLRVAMDWRAPLDRIWTEHATLELLGAILPEGTVPTVLFEDRAELPVRDDLRPGRRGHVEDTIDGGPDRPDDRRAAGYDPGHDPR